ncbi:hypothetical protein B6D60_10595 [candidate division KSB1 bacterium 4484_87]|nr:MAG: hypothetical protein B6D60_10595 [candidate division KSB1 bacterium 4484_87]
MSVNLLDLIPQKKLESRENEDGTITILKPKYQNKFMKKYVLPRMKKPHFNVNLDEYGSFVWKHIDGDKTVEDIGKDLQKNFSEKIEPVYERLSVFIHSLVRYKFIEFKNYHPEKEEKGSK